MGLSFEDLVVWKRSYSLASQIYKLMKNSKEYVLRDQILRSAISIASNIAEGSERKSSADFKRFLCIAKGSAAELRTQIYIARDNAVLDSQITDSIIKDLKEISRMLQGLEDSI